MQYRAAGCAPRTPRPGSWDCRSPHAVVPRSDLRPACPYFAYSSWTLSPDVVVSMARYSRAASRVSSGFHSSCCIALYGDHDVTVATSPPRSRCGLRMPQQMSAGQSSSKTPNTRQLQVRPLSWRAPPQTCKAAPSPGAGKGCRTAEGRTRRRTQERPESAAMTPSPPIRI